MFCMEYALWLFWDISHSHIHILQTLTNVFLPVSSLRCHSNLTRGVGRFREILRAIETRTTQSLRMVRDGLAFFYFGLGLGDVYISLPSSVSCGLLKGILWLFGKYAYLLFLQRVRLGLRWLSDNPSSQKVAQHITPNFFMLWFLYGLKKLDI